MMVQTYTKGMTCGDYVVAYTRLSKCILFFFSSRRRHTRLQGDWSSDVCSSDLLRSLVGLLPEAQATKEVPKQKEPASAKRPQAVYDLISLDGNKPYDARDLLASKIGRAHV